MKLALFIPCYVDQLYPHVGVATLMLLRSLGHQVDVPLSPRCCGQPLMNSGNVAHAAPMIREFAALLKEHELVVCPSASCVSMVRNHHPHCGESADPAGSGAPSGRPPRIMELCEFLHDVEQVREFPHPFPHRVVVHKGCHGLRELRLGHPSEEGGAPGPDKVSSLLRLVPELVLQSASRPDECCGFGGTFAVTEPEVSCAMGRARIASFEESGAEIVASTDMSCVMHLDGLIRRQSATRQATAPLRTVHVAEIFAGRVQ